VLGTGVQTGALPIWLDLDRIVQAAIEVADAEDLGTLSMRKVAERLGVGTMSLYTYVPGKSELIDLMFDQAVAGPNEPVRGTWRERRCSQPR
jgi:AcrR family transcriptional regulator